MLSTCMHPSSLRVKPSPLIHPNRSVGPQGWPSWTLLATLSFLWRRSRSGRGSSCALSDDDSDSDNQRIETQRDPDRSRSFTTVQSVLLHDRGQTALTEDASDGLKMDLALHLHSVKSVSPCPFLIANNKHRQAFSSAIPPFSAKPPRSSVEFVKDGRLLRLWTREKLVTSFSVLFLACTIRLNLRKGPCSAPKAVSTPFKRVSGMSSDCAKTLLDLPEA